MNEKEIRDMVQGLDDDLMAQELDALTAGLEIDMDAVLEKSLAKLEQESDNMKNKKLRVFPLIAAAVVLVAGTTAAYAQEISDFIKSFLGQSTMYGTVVDGEAYYLESPVALAGGGQVHSAMSHEDRLDLIIDAEFTDIAIKIDGALKEPGGYGGRSSNGKEYSFYSVGRIQELELVLDGKSQVIKLSKAPGAADEDILPAQPNGIDWINMGYRRIEGGVQLFTSIDDGKATLRAYGQASRPGIEETFSNGEDGNYLGNATVPGPAPLVGIAKDGTTYEYSVDVYEAGLPLTKFYSNAPANAAITLNVPAIVVSYDVRDSSSVTLPPVGESRTEDTVFDLGLQKMRLRSIERTSATTAKLVFDLDIEDSKLVTTRDADMSGSNVQSGELQWKDSVCTMEATFKEDLQELELVAQDPVFHIWGNWTLEIE